MGRALAEAALAQGHDVVVVSGPVEVTYPPGITVRPVVSTEEIFSPVVARPNSLLVMNQPSWDYFGPRLDGKGLAVVNSSMVKVPALEGSRRLLLVPATEIATELGEIRAANMVMLGAYNRVRDLLPLEALLESLRLVLGERKAGLYEVNARALRKGAELAED